MARRRALEALLARLAPPPAPTYNRLPPEAFGSFGAGSVIHEPARLLTPERIHVGAGVTILGGCWLSVVTAHNGRTYDPVLRIGDGCVLGHDTVIACVGEVTLGRRVLTS